MNSTQHQEYVCKCSNCLPISLSDALTEVEETAELIQAEVEEITELLHQQLDHKNTISTDLVLQNLLYKLFKCIRSVMAVDTITLLRPTEDGQQLSVSATLGLEEEITAGIRIPLGRGFAGRIAASCQLTIVEDLSKVEVVSPILRNKGIQSMLGVPLLVKDRIIGVFHVGTVHPRQFTKEDAQLLQLVATQIELAIAHIELASTSISVRTLIQEKFALICSLQKLSRVISFHFQPLLTGYLELALSPLRLVFNSLSIATRCRACFYQLRLNFCF